MGRVRAALPGGLEANPALDELVSVAERESLVTLLHAARDTERNHAAVVAAVVVERLSGPGAPRGR